MEPKNHPCEKEKNIWTKPSFFGFHVKFRGCKCTLYHPWNFDQYRSPINSDVWSRERKHECLTKAHHMFKFRGCRYFRCPFWNDQNIWIALLHPFNLTQYHWSWQKIQLVFIDAAYMKIVYMHPFHATGEYHPQEYLIAVSPAEQNKTRQNTLPDNTSSVFYVVVSTHVKKKISQIGSLLQAGVNIWNTLLGTNTSPKNGILKMIFLFPRWDMLIPWRVIETTTTMFFFGSPHLHPKNFLLERQLFIRTRSFHGLLHLWKDGWIPSPQVYVAKKKNGRVNNKYISNNKNTCLHISFK